MEERMMVEARVRSRNKKTWTATGLNDVVIHQADESRVVHLEIRIEKTSIGTLAADGLVIASPTGSTAYSLSAGGPIVRPTIEALLATPICAHALAFRPLLVGGDETVHVRVQPGATRARHGGWSDHPPRPGEVQVCRRGPRSVVSVKRESFYEVLRKKRAW
jgi:NAD+ kinase